MSEQICVRCTIMRGGTSRAVFLNENHVPRDIEERKHFILALFGSPDARQIDGLGGAEVLTSKCAIIGPSTRPDADVDYTFLQVGIADSTVSTEIICGNISSAVGPYAIEEGFVRWKEPITTVRVYNTNTDKIMLINVPVKDGHPLVEGDYIVDGVPGSGAEIQVDYSYTIGSSTGKLLPTDNVIDQIFIPSLNRNIEISIVDIATISAFFRAEDIGLTGIEKPNEISQEKIKVFEEIRQAASDLCGLPKENFITPFTIAVASSKSFKVFSTGKLVDAEEVDFVTRMTASGTIHKALSGAAASCVSVASQIPGTIVNQCTASVEQPRYVRVGHPSGVIKTYTDVVSKNGEVMVNSVCFSRTARRIMEGYAYIRKARL
ncbi:MAG: PrpF domain-containing protein [Sedimentibacter sp.]